jgi:hypothetical protein
MSEILWLASYLVLGQHNARVTRNEAPRSIKITIVAVSPSHDISVEADKLDNTFTP